MKKFTAIIFIFLILFSGCSDKSSSRPSMKLTMVDTELIIREIEGSKITSGKRKGEKAKELMLCYDIRLKNTGDTTIGRMKKQIDEEYFPLVNVSLEPNDKLKTAVKEVIGTNIFNLENNIGHEIKYRDILKPHETGSYEFKYYLGELGDEHIKKLGSSEEIFNELFKLLEHSKEAVLVVRIRDEVIATFDIDNYN
ncbi:MAG: hypothetical protein FH758_01855 [Firmicutes bacterium]|nr:hypothetical protein [Bacillota bacterium]